MTKEGVVVGGKREGEHCRRLLGLGGDEAWVEKVKMRKK